MTESFIIVGGGGHALSVADTALCMGYRIKGCVAPDFAKRTQRLLPCLGDELPDCPLKGSPIALINGIGSAGPISSRRRVFIDHRQAGYSFVDLMHPSASLAALDTVLGNATQIMAGAIVNAGVTLGDNVLINSGAIIEHGCHIGSHSHIASGATVCGDCVIEEAVHVGAGATLIQGIAVGFGAVIAAGAVVTADVEPLTLVAGVPAQKRRSINEQELA